MKNITQIEKAILGNDNLDEYEKRYEERKQKTARAKALLDDILSACEGGGIGNENADWATRGLLEILELFTFNKNSKITPQDMAEDLQHHLFTWELNKEKRLEYLTPQTVPLFTFFQFFDN